jgi:hypothetical protein
LANTLTGLIPTLYEARNRVSREMVGMIPAVTVDASAEKAGINQTIRVPIGQAGALEDITAGQLPANTGGTTVNYADLVITKSKAAPVLWTGEEVKAVGTTGVYNKVLADQFTDAMRKIVNAVEVDLALASLIGASRACGTAGTAPFGTSGDLSGSALARQILEDNGAPTEDMQLVLGSAAMANLRAKQSVLFKVNEAGSSDMLRNGLTERLEGFALRNSAGIVRHVKGTGASYQSNGGNAVGDTTIPVGTGTGTILAGDVVTLAGDSNNYIVGSALTAGSFKLNAPGVLNTVATTTALTVGNTFVANLAFARTAILLGARAPAVPEGGDSADDRIEIMDPMSGLVFQVSMYRQYRQVKYEVALAWGVSAIKSEHIAVLMG